MTERIFPDFINDRLDAEQQRQADLEARWARLATIDLPRRRRWLQPWCALRGHRASDGTCRCRAVRAVYEVR